MGPHIVEGELAFDCPPAGKPLKSWYKVTGDITRTSNSLFILHGGPGTGAEAYNIFSDLTVKYGIPIIQYDRVGCKHSTHLQEKKGAGPAFWKDAIFVLELHKLIRHFGLDIDNRQYDVICHSWGVMFGTAFAGGRPKGLRRYIVWYAAPSSQLWDAAQAGLQKTMPQEIQDIFEKCKRENTMGGQDPNETWSAIDSISAIEVPVLLISRRYDQAQDSCLLAFFERLKSQDKSSHMAHYEERERFMEVLPGEFLTRNN
ncbi:Alpha/Beta hydrolase protein [Irpex lacteus]|nr:Alpha/Beta hydrolase protein [Irpex lacteus]